MENHNFQWSYTTSYMGLLHRQKNMAISNAAHSSSPLHGLNPAV